MYSIEWVAHHHERESARSEASFSSDLDDIVQSCIDRLPLMRERELVVPPDGFLIFDHHGLEVRRWFGTPRMLTQGNRLPRGLQPGWRTMDEPAA